MIPEPTITKIHATPDFCKREVVPFNNYATALDDLGYVRGRRALAGLWGVEVQTLAPEGERQNLLFQKLI